MTRGTSLTLRLLLAACLALAGLAPSAPRAQVDPALAFARAAGALCEAPGTPEAPGQHSHASCLACPLHAGAALPPTLAPLAAPSLPLAAAAPSRPAPALSARHAPYAPRAPPGTPA